MPNYAIPGPFGTVQLAPTFKPSDPALLDQISGAGKHAVNELYHISRPTGTTTFLLLVTTSGRGCATIDAQSFDLLPEHVLIIPPFVPSSYWAPSGGHWEFDWVHIDGVHANSILSHVVRDGYLYPVAITGICSLIQMLIETDCPYPDSDLFASDMASRILHELLYMVRMAQKDRYDDLVWDLIRDLEAHCREPLNLSEWSNRYYMSVEYMIRLFREKTGTSPYHFYLRCKLQHAAQLLTYSDFSIEQIAKKVGYCNASAFGHQFKMIYGETPSGYRKSKKVYQN